MKRNIKSNLLKTAAAAVLSAAVFSAVFAGINNTAYAYQKPNYTVVFDRDGNFPHPDTFPADSHVGSNKEAYDEVLGYHTQYIGQLDGALQASISMEEAAEAGAKAITEILELNMNGQTVTMWYDINSLLFGMQHVKWNSWRGFVEITNIESPVKIDFWVRADTGEMLSMSMMFIVGQEQNYGKTYNVYDFYRERSHYGSIGFKKSQIDDLDNYIELYPEAVEAIRPFLQTNNEYAAFAKNIVETNRLLPDVKVMTLNELMFPFGSEEAIYGNECAATYVVESSNGDKAVVI